MAKKLTDLSQLTKAILKDAGNKVTKIRVADKKIGYCTGCYACQKTHKCVHELLKAKVGDGCSFALHIESAEDMRRKAAAPQPKKRSVFQPKLVKDDFLAKLRLHRKRCGW